MGESIKIKLMKGLYFRIGVYLENYTLKIISEKLYLDTRKYEGIYWENYTLSRLYIERTV